MNKKVIVFGTRPEFIKFLPIISEVKLRNAEDEYCYIFTGQHSELVVELFELFDFKPTYTIPQVNHFNSLSESFSFILAELQKIIDHIKTIYSISIVLGQGDTTSCVCAAFCAFFNHLPFGHVEAGLRTYNLNHPFPEELFRRIISQVSTINFAPTQLNYENLLLEGIKSENIIITGNTIVDTVSLLKNSISQKVAKNSSVRQFESGKVVLVTCHRRENQNSNFNKILSTVQKLASENSSLQFIWISHMTPFVKSILEGQEFHSIVNIHILPPINIFEMYFLYERTCLIITDSGGVQEEAPSFNIPVVLIRECTERTESVDLQYSEVVGFDEDQLIRSFNKHILKTPLKMINPYGDGNASQMIVSYLQKNYQNELSE